MKGGWSNLSLLPKAVLVTSAVITILLGVTGWLVQRYAVRTTSQGLEEEVRASLRAYESMWRSRADMLASGKLVISNMSDVRAAFSTRDKATIQDTAGELWAKISHEDAIFLVTDPDGVVMASLRGSSSNRERADRVGPRHPDSRNRHRVHASRDRSFIRLS